MAHFAMMLAAMTPGGGRAELAAMSEDDMCREVELARDAAKRVIKQAFDVDLTEAEAKLDLNEASPAVCALAFGLAFTSFCESYGIGEQQRYALVSAACKVIES